MKTKHFTVNEANPDDSESGHIGTVSANSAEELRSKLIDAITSHVDEDVEVGKIEWEILSDHKPIEVQFNAAHFLSGWVDVRETWIY